MELNLTSISDEELRAVINAGLTAYDRGDAVAVYRAYFEELLRRISRHQSAPHEIVTPTAGPAMRRP